VNASCPSEDILYAEYIGPYPKERRRRRREEKENREEAKKNRPSAQCNTRTQKKEVEKVKRED
jgi:hypothetical protein